MEPLSRLWQSLGFGAQPPAKAAQAESRFRYSAELIPGLKDDHQGLLKQYGAIERMISEGRHAEIPDALAAFKEAFDVHILNENLHFYCYIEERSKTLQQRELIKSFRGEMNAIARGVINFVKIWRASGVSAATGPQFLIELGQVGTLLVRRIEREEKDLYTLYQP